MANSTVIYGKWESAANCAEKVASTMQNEGFETQVLSFGEQIVVQCRNTSKESFGGFLKKAVGLGNVTTLKLERVNGADVSVETAGGQWLDKAAVMGVSMIVLWPLFITSGIGMIRQNQTAKKLYEYSLQYLAN